jgi:hypothetical protein
VKVRDAIDARVATADDPIPSSTIAWQLQKDFGLGPWNRWGGRGEFKDLILALPDHVFVVAWVGPAWFYDPARHDAPGTPGAPVTFTDTEVEAVARRVAAVTDIPLLSSEDYFVVFDLLAEHVSANGYSIAETTSWLRDEAKARDIPLARGGANYLVKGITYGGVQLPASPPSEPINPDDLALGFLRSAEASAAQAQVILMPTERDALERWLAPAPPSSQS